MTTKRGIRRNDTLLDAVEALARRRLQGDEIAAVTRFAEALYAGVAEADLRDARAEDRFGATMGLWRFGGERPPGTARIRVFDPMLDCDGWRSSHSIVEIVNDDMPFLVDSVMATLLERGGTIHLIAHPVLAVRRDANGRLLEAAAAEARPETEGWRRESWMQLEIDRCVSAEAREELQAAIEAVLRDVRAAVEDFPAMRARLAAARADLAGLSDGGAPSVAELGETLDFLDWLDREAFVFLGYRRYDSHDQEGGAAPKAGAPLAIRAESGLGILRDRAVSVFEGARDWAVLDDAGRAQLRDPIPITVTKAARRATVHRRAHLDVVSVKRLGADGTIQGEDLFVGLFTSAAYARSPREIPWLRGKIARTVEQAGLAPGSHDGKALIHILDTYPRDDLFQIDEATLLATATGILGLQERPRTALFVRRDPYGRFVSCLVFVPHDRHSTEMRRRIQEILEIGFGGTLAAFSTRVADGAQARIHFVLRTDPATAREAAAPVAEIEARIVEAARGWTDLLSEALIERFGEGRGLALARRYADAFPAGYRETTGPNAATIDIERIEAVLEHGRIEQALRRTAEAGPASFHFELYHRGAPVPLSDVLPVLEHLGLRVISEMPTRVAAAAADPVWIHDFAVESRAGEAVDLALLRPLFQDAFARVWSGAAEDDRLNGLVLAANLSWRQVTVLRAYARFLRQARFAYAQETVESALLAHPRIAAAIVRLFEARFDPDRPGDREAAGAAIAGALDQALEAVENLDEDRILRRFVTLVRATLRTNHWQRAADGGPKPWLALKLDSGAIDELPAPRPWREIFVHSPRMEGVHLRGGAVARGGIRWSDRREDFRTEILDLMKAQTVKNAVIVPAGAKGGFVVKRPPAPGPDGPDRDAIAAEGRECYCILVRGLLDVTDTVEGETIRPPERVIRHDGDDPYLVVAADKGTATFSDTANGIAAEYGFWLGDAFASGGSAGYDHKAMGITARGAWVSVQRHFREMGRDIQAEPFTCVGVGDMAGDVFGNGLLLSRQARLLAAFNHRHIFVDPDPDPEASFEERARLFARGRGSWDAYAPELISPGGGVFDRRAKSIPIGKEIRALFGIEAEQVTPAALIRAILSAEIDLIWFGGIGTFVKAAAESHAEVGDKANDGLRIDAEALRARVIGEGANLAMTQRARIAYARAGGRLNTDFIDNSGGVDCSDHEVNIKILLDGLVRAGEMTGKQRDALLAEMTDEVASLVLENNDGQTRALSLAAAEAPATLERQARLIRNLERAGRIDRILDVLPDDEAIADRAARREGLSRPEQAVLLSHVKLWLGSSVVASDLPDDPALAPVLRRYFPTPLRDRAAAAIDAHPLRREIATTRIVSEMVDRMGLVFAAERAERTGHDAADIVRAFVLTRTAFDLPDLWDEIEALDRPDTVAVQTAMLLAVRDFAGRAIGWVLRRRAFDLSAATDRLRPGLAAYDAALDQALYPEALAVVEARAEGWAAEGAPPRLAARVARLNLRASGLDVLQVAEQSGLPDAGTASIPAIAALYFETGRRFGFATLRDAGRAVPVTGPWTGEAVEAAVEELQILQTDTTCRILADSGLPDRPAAEAVEAWAAARAVPLGRIDRLLTDLKAAATPDLAMLTVATRALRALAVG